MACNNFYMKLVLVLCASWAVSIAVGQPFKAVNLGNWLVTEGWMKPSLFREIPNKDLLDGTQVQFKSTKLQKYICPENGGGTIVVANRTSASGWETFRLWRINETSFNFRVCKKQFVGLSKHRRGIGLVAESKEPQNNETFQIERNTGYPDRVRIKASNGCYLQAKSEDQVTADFQGSGWEDSNPSVFEMTIVRTLLGEYQITNGYGPDRAPKVMQNHWNTYITEEDFGFLSSNGINAVRIPVGWWIAKDPSPPKPYVGGSLNALDNAFKWAQKHEMKVIVDLHAVQGSQNGEHHSSSRDGFLEWGDSYIQDTVDVIDFLARRYGNNQSLAAIELMNEPFAASVPCAPGVSLETLKKYYQAGYNAVRNHTSSAYVILSNRIRAEDPKELLLFAKGLGTRVAIDVHYYNLYDDKFNNMTVQQNIDFIYNKRSANLSEVTTSNGPLVFVGLCNHSVLKNNFASTGADGSPNESSPRIQRILKLEAKTPTPTCKNHLLVFLLIPSEWTGEWELKINRTEEEEGFRNFIKAQLDVYGRATFGWAYWAYKCQNNSNPWSLRWMIENQYITL